MAVLAYASAVLDPVANPGTAAEVDLAVVSLPVDVPLYGAGVDTADGGAVWTYSWSILSAPAGSAAALSSTTGQNPSLLGVDLWGNYVLALVVTNTNTGGVSETDPREIPSAALVVVKVLSAGNGLEKPAAGQRGWTAALHRLIDLVDGSGAGVGAHTLTDHSDVVDATGAQLEVLTGHSYVDDPEAPGSPLHRHRGAEVDPASILDRGTVVLESAPLDPVNPRVINAERLWLTGAVDITFGPGGPGFYIGGPADPARPHLIWLVPEDVILVQWWAFLEDGGAAAASSPLELQLVTGTWADAESRALVDLGAALSVAPVLDNAPVGARSAVGAVAIPAGSALALVVKGGDSINPARSLRAGVQLVRGV